MKTEKLGAQNTQRNYTVSKTQNSSVDNMVSFDKNDKGDQVSFSGKLPTNSFMKKLRNSKVTLTFFALTTLGGGYLINQNNKQQDKNDTQQKEITVLQKEISTLKKFVDHQDNKSIEASKALKIGQERLTKQINTEIAPYSLKNLENVAKKASPSTALFNVLYADKEGGIGYFLGSGFMIAPNLLLTNAHVLNTEAKDIKELAKEGFDDFKMFVQVPDLEYAVEFKKENIIAFDTCYDLAVVKLPDGVKFPSSAKPLKLSDEKLLQGECVATMGGPLGYDNSFSAGVVSETKRVESQRAKDAIFIQTDAAISEGSSGGPLMNLKGEVVGVNNEGVKNGQNINFAIDIPSVKAFLSKHHIKLENPTKSKEK